jgi:hypothetical protein
VDQNVDVDFERINLYAYDTWRPTPWLSLTGGVTYNHMLYPQNFTSPPVNDKQTSLENVLPKAGIILEPWRGAAVRAAYSRAISGASFDENIRLEPTQVAGFLADLPFAGFRIPHRLGDGREVRTHRPKFRAETSLAHLSRRRTQPARGKTRPDAGDSRLSDF